MNTDKHESPPDILEKATAELRSSRATSAPSPELLAATIHQLESNPLGSKPIQHEVVSHKPPRAGQSSTRRSQMIKLVQWSSLTAAAAVLIAIAVASFFGPRGAAFAQVIEKIKKATSVSVTCTQRAGAHDPGPTRCFMQGDQMRLDVYMRGDKPAVSPHTVIVADFKKLEVLHLDLDEKTYLRNQGVDKEAMRQLGSPLKWLAELTNENVELISEEELNGQKVQAYRLKKIEYPLGVGKIDEKKTNRVWVDPKTGLPAKIIVNYFDTENNRDTEDVYDNFRWNEPIAEELFSLVAPDGFKAADSIGGGDAIVPPFAEVLKRIKKASTVVFTSKHRLGSEPVEQQKYYYMGDMMRIESQKNNGQHVLVINSKTGEAINIVPAQRTAAKSKFSRAFPGQPTKSPVDLIAEAAEKDAQWVGDEELNGKKVCVYRVTFRDSKQSLTGETAKIWVDPANNLPIRIESAYIKPDDPKKRVQISGECENFEWNVPLKLELFQVPKGYSVEDDAPGQLAPVRPVN